MKSSFIAICLLFVATCANAQGIPKLIWGKWIISREIPTSGVACWGDAQAKSLLGTNLYYSSRIFRWEKTVIKNPKATEKVLNKKAFEQQYSSFEARYSVDLRDLGIMAKKVVVISIHHPPENITGATTEIPGDEVFVKNKNALIFSVCGVYFEAKRVR